MNPNTLQKAELLANKLDKLNTHFDIVGSTINECAEYVESIDSTIIQHKPEGVLDEVELLSYLRADFLTARDTLLATMKDGRTVINAINSKLTIFEEDSNNAELVSAYASLLKTVNDGTKLLINMYSDIIKTHQLIEKKNVDKKVVIEGDVSINTISGNISDIIKEFKQVRAN